MLKINLKKIFVFDWDGTLFNSMPIKRKTFTESIYLTLKNKRKVKVDKEITLSTYVEFSGLPRKEIFQKVLEKFDQDFEEDLYDSFNKLLTRKNKKLLTEANLFSATIEFFIELVHKSKKIYISSSVPQEELDFLVHAKIPVSILSTISSVFGSSDGFAKGKQHFEKILEFENCSTQDILFLGDEIMDFQLSQKFGVDCIIIDRDDRFLLRTEIKKIKSLMELDIV